MNDGLPMDLMNLQMSWCIICRFKQPTNNVLVQKCIKCKGLIKYIKVHGSDPMTTYVEITHPKLFAIRKQQFNVVAEPSIIHARQLGKKRISTFNCVIIDLFGATNPYKNK